MHLLKNYAQGDKKVSLTEQMRYLMETIEHASNIVQFGSNPVKTAPIGTPVFIVPIRYWENQEPETGHIVAHINVDGKETSAGPEHIYVFHDGYGHNVYTSLDRAFLTRDEAIDEANRLKAIKDAEFEDRVALTKIPPALWAKMVAWHQKPKKE